MRGQSIYLTLALLLITAEPGASGDRQPPPAAPVLPADPTADAVESVLKVTVTIEGDGIYGAGLLIDPPAGLVLTDYHVVDEMKHPRVTSWDGRVGSARVIAQDAKLDLAILAVPELKSPDLQAPRFADPASLRPGEEVYAIGSPRKLPFTVSRGIVSYVGRDMEGARYLQLDMAINDGNSGGPVLTRRGEVVAVMSFILRRSQGLSFALPMPYASAAFPQLLPKIATKRNAVVRREVASAPPDSP